MKYSLLLIAFIPLFLIGSAHNGISYESTTEETVFNVYHDLDISNLNYSTFSRAYHGYLQLKNDELLEKDILTIIDFTLSSNIKRLWIIDMKEHKVLYNELVAHGRNSGQKYAEKFSNIPNSNLSSLGFYITDATYHGKHGLSLLINGIEPGINDNARKRAIVIHGADYVSSDFIKKYGRLGRSLGCPALSRNVSKHIIKLITKKSCLYIHGNDPEYITKSRFKSPNDNDKIMKVFSQKTTSKGNALKSE